MWEVLGAALLDGALGTDLLGWQTGIGAALPVVATQSSAAVAGCATGLSGIAATAVGGAHAIFALGRRAAVAILFTLLAVRHAALLVPLSALAAERDAQADVVLEAAVVGGGAGLLSLLELATVLAAAGALIAEAVPAAVAIVLAGSIGVFATDSMILTPVVFAEKRLLATITRDVTEFLQPTAIARAFAVALAPVALVAPVLASLPFLLVLAPPPFSFPRDFVSVGLAFLLLASRNAGAGATLGVCLARLRFALAVVRASGGGAECRGNEGCQQHAQSNAAAREQGELFGERIESDAVHGLTPGEEGEEDPTVRDERGQRQRGPRRIRFSTLRLPQRPVNTHRRRFERNLSERPDRTILLDRLGRVHVMRFGGASAPATRIFLLAPTGETRVLDSTAILTAS
jgi:hypothetical protein